MSKTRGGAEIAKFVGLSVLYFAIGLVLIAGAAKLVAGIQPFYALKGTPSQNLILAILCVPILIAYALHIRFVERRVVSDFAPRFLAGDLALGLLLSAGVMLASAGLLALFGGFAITGINGWSYSVSMAACSALFAGVSEEVLYRGLLMRLIERIGGTWLALAATSVLFGLAHLSNAHVSLAGVLGLTFGLGLMLGAAYVATRRLWLPIALHAGWNFTMGSVLDVANSGVAEGSLLSSRLQGSAWLTGGAWGFEASIQAPLLAFMVAVLFLRSARRHGRIVPPLAESPI